MKKVLIIIIPILLIGGAAGYFFWKKKQVKDFILTHESEATIGLYFDNPTSNKLTVYFDSDTLDLLPYGGAFLGLPLFDPPKQHRMVCVKENKEVLCDTSFISSVFDHTFINPGRSTYIQWTLRYIAEDASPEFLDSVMRTLSFNDKKVIADMVVQSDVEFKNSIFPENQGAEQMLLLNGRSVDKKISGYKNGDNVDYRFFMMRLEDFVLNYKHLYQLSDYEKHRLRLNYELERLGRAILVTHKITGGTANPIVPFLVTKEPYSPQSYQPIIDFILSKKSVHQTPAYTNPYNPKESYKENEPFNNSMAAFDSIKACWQRGDTIVPKEIPFRKITVTLYETYCEGEWNPVVKKKKTVKVLGEKGLWQ